MGGKTKFKKKKRKQKERGDSFRDRMPRRWRKSAKKKNLCRKLKEKKGRKGSKINQKTSKGREV